MDGRMVLRFFFLTFSYRGTSTRPLFVVNWDTCEFLSRYIRLDVDGSFVFLPLGLGVILEWKGFDPALVFQAVL